MLLIRGISDEVLGECGSCALVPLDSTSCPSCSVRFVADDVVSVLSEWMGRNNMSVEGLFSKFDDNGDGVIESSELKQGLLDRSWTSLHPRWNVWSPSSMKMATVSSIWKNSLWLDSGDGPDASSDDLYSRRFRWCHGGYGGRT